MSVALALFRIHILDSFLVIDAPVSGQRHHWFRSSPPLATSRRHGLHVLHIPPMFGSCQCTCRNDAPPEQGEELHNVDGVAYRRCACRWCGRLERGKFQCHVRIPIGDGQARRVCHICLRSCESRPDSHNAPAIGSAAQPSRPKKRKRVSLHSRESVERRGVSGPSGPSVGQLRGRYNEVFGDLRLSEISLDDDASDSAQAEESRA